MAAQTITLGPWTGGLNYVRNRDLSVFLNPNELGEATNITYSRDGFIEPRPGCKVVLDPENITDPAKKLYQAPNLNNFKTLGSVTLPTGETVVLVNNYYGGVSHVYKVYSPTHIDYYFQASTEFTHVISHQANVANHSGVIFFSKGDDNSYLTTDFTLATVPTKITPITGDPATSRLGVVPGSDGGVIVKNRLFLWKYDTSTFMSSSAIKILEWTNALGSTTNVDPQLYQPIERTTAADGIMAVLFLKNSFYIFKRTKTFMYTYQEIPYSDGYLRKISDEFGALDATMYRNNVVVLNNKGVFRVENDTFTDLQSQLNLRFEIPLDHNNIQTDNVFVTDFNNDLVMGYRDISDASNPKIYYYVMNGQNGAWSKWDFTYTKGSASEDIIASPGCRQYLCQDSNTSHQTMIFSTFDKKHLVYMDWKPKDLRSNTPGSEGPGDYHLDSNLTSITSHNNYYIPNVIIKTRASVGGTLLQYKKVYRAYMRLYLSEQPSGTFFPDSKSITLPTPTTGNWVASINYNDYRFRKDTEHDPEQFVDVFKQDTAPASKLLTPGYDNTIRLERTHQIPIQQIRAKEFVFELTRTFSIITKQLNNQDPDRLVKQGYYFMLSGVWFDYQDKAGI